MNSDGPDAGASELANSGGGKPAASRRSGRSGRSCPPYNPGLYKLVEGKQAWAEPLDDEAKARGFLGWHQRGYVPHHDVPGVTQLVTFRLNDAMPASRRSEWEVLLRIEEDRERRTKLEEYLDCGLGECWLRQPRIADLAEGALRFFDGQRYRLGAWVVMPNHIHVLLEVWQTPLAGLLKSWKGFTAREANKLLGREGTFWEREYWDTRIRDEQQLRKAVRYVEANPLKASLVREAKAWQWSSARFRDEFGVLRTPKPSVGTNGAQPGAPASKPA
jgi:REP element-mobilizing transposase RayT